MSQIGSFHLALQWSISLGSNSTPADIRLILVQNGELFRHLWSLIKLLYPGFPEMDPATWQAFRRLSAGRMSLENSIFPSLYRGCRCAASIGIMTRPQPAGIRGFTAFPL